MKLETLIIIHGNLQIKIWTPASLPNSSLASHQNTLNAPATPSHFPFLQVACDLHSPFPLYRSFYHPSCLFQITQSCTIRTKLLLKEALTSLHVQFTFWGTHETLCCNILWHDRECILLWVSSMPATSLACSMSPIKVHFFKAHKMTSSSSLYVIFDNLLTLANFFCINF